MLHVITFPSISHYLTRRTFYGKIEENIYFKNDAKIYLFTRFVFTSRYVEKCRYYYSLPE